ncbi:PREDICTED: pentatricopeptide repeat-containing protein At3g60960, mitochondrial-like [Camelina sativa]|uniref:Pentatricopeptide repeat-containing protein At3g60960, mitochondrial-like n=1 Tax=Camelina sativa TaxID=90675 RepID=A0ABM0XRQ6_CAMSA|nr:PREDICTED: pentatricopeptide repeat-containing protein At3g60960, mitochondrial-like [Camelina sativa]XP_010497145.1 PREDICTED: pentatricopeptide repeat-containing protein At3g60960, mitochondrial-like [Camelina sativa]
MFLRRCLSSSSAAMSLRRSLVGLIINTNYTSLSIRRFSSVSDHDDYFNTLREVFMNPKVFMNDKRETIIDKRPISLRFRVSSLIELCQPYQASLVSRLAVSEKYRTSDSETIIIRDEIIGAMCAAKKYKEAIDLYKFFRSESTLASSSSDVSFNHIIKAHIDENRVDKALGLCNPLYDGVDTCRLLTKALVDTGRTLGALSFVKARKDLRDSVVYSYLIRGFLDLGNHDKAYELFDEFKQKTIHDDAQNRRAVVVDATFVDYWLKQGEEEKGMEIYRSLVEREGELVVCAAATGNTLLEVLLDSGKQTEAWELFNAMIANPETFDRETFTKMVNASFKLGKFKEALETFKRPELTRSSRCYSNIIAQLCDRGMMSEAEDLFSEICSDQYLCPDVPTFRSMINGYAKTGRFNEARKMLEKMVDATLLKFSVHEAQ